LFRFRKEKLFLDFDFLFRFQICLDFEIGICLYFEFLFRFQICLGFDFLFRFSNLFGFRIFCSDLEKIVLEFFVWILKFCSHFDFFLEFEYV
jgi:hypothetical protein